MINARRDYRTRVRGPEATRSARCEDRLGTVPPRARTDVIYVDLLGYFGLDPPKRGSGLVGNKLISVQRRGYCDW